MNKLFYILCTLTSLNGFAIGLDRPVMMSYVEVNSNDIKDVGCYVRSDNHKPVIDMVSIFAANIHGSNPNKPVIYLNSRVDFILNKTTQVADLHSKGIKVLLTLLGDHEQSGWSCMTDANAAQNFAAQIVDTMNQYHLDGVDIDDEYSNCPSNSTSMIMLAQFIKKNPNFTGKILSKALYQDYDVFSATYEGHKLSDFLDYGWEMTYGNSNFSSRLGNYLTYGMTKDKLMLGGWTNLSYPYPEDMSSFVIQNNYAGIMIYDVKNDSQNYLSKISKKVYGSNINVDVLPGCFSQNEIEGSL